MFKYFHLCTHEAIDKGLRESEQVVFVVNKGDDIDNLIRGASVIEIHEVRAITYTPRKEAIQLQYDIPINKNTYDNPLEEQGYYDGARSYYQDYSLFFKEGETKSEPLPTWFYSTHLKNNIKWNVEPPLTYEVKMAIRFDRELKKSFAPAECEICHGKGWFVDILNNSATFEVDKGATKVIQRLVKDILTELSTNVLELNYGTRIKKTVSRSVKSDEELFDDIRLIVSEVESNYLQRQSLEYTQLAADERLVSATAENVFRSSNDKRRIILELNVVTEAEDRNFRLSL